MKALPDTHKSAIAWLAERGSDGLIDKYGRVVAQGEAYKSAETAAVWLRLVASGHVIGDGAGRLTFTMAGHAEARKIARPPVDQIVPTGRRGRMMVDDNAEDFA